MKTGISIDPALVTRVDALAKTLRVSRSEVFSQAVKSFLRDYESRQMLNQLNAVYGAEPDDEEERITQGFHKLHAMRAEQEL